MGIMVFTGRSNKKLAKRIEKSLKKKLKKNDFKLSEIEFTDFDNQNIKVKSLESVRGKDVFVIQTSCPPVHKNIMELLIMLHAFKGASAKRITAVIPYFPYVRSDKKDEPRISITARLIADLLKTSGASRVLTMDLHAAQIQGFFDMPADQLLALPVFCDYFESKNINDMVVVAGDVGRAKLNRMYSEKLKAPMAVLDKSRRGLDGKPQILAVTGEVSGKNAVMFDDEILTGGSLIALVDALKENGVKDIYAGITHGILAKNAVERIEKSDIKELVVTDTVRIPKKKLDNSTKIKVISVADLFAETIIRIHCGQSVSPLFGVDTEKCDI
ncbi:ribose-phosphate diphosphokinase [Candidatus Poribacteria bacterium]|nr:ribose-phosphate diphosphokinase [Candidatus Poribacteria bacterium]